MIACKLTNNDTIFYSPEAHAFYNSDGSFIQIDYERNALNPEPTLSLRIVLGRKCNFNCVYCIQSEVRESNEKLDNNFSLLELGQEILRVAGGRKIGGVLFWGGEPLVYFKQMQEIQKILKPYCDTSSHGNFFIVTNGLELKKKEVTEWLKEESINVTISYDGPGQDLRGKDIFKDDQIVKATKYLMEHHPDRVSVLPVFSRKNPSLKKYVDYLHDIFGETIPMLGCVSTTTVVDDGMFETVIPAEELPDFYKDLTNSLINNEFVEWKQAGDKIHSFFRTYNQGGTTRVCSALGEDVLVLDMAGDILFCHNADKNNLNDRTGNPLKLGNIKQIDSGGMFPWAGHDYQEEEKCKICLVRSLCAGGCWYGKKKYMDYNCKAHYYYNLAFMNYIIYLLFGQEIKEVELLPG